MKYLLLILLPVFSYAQPRGLGQDSIVYKKLKNGGSITITIDLPKSELGDSLFYRLSFSNDQNSSSVSIISYTDVDSLVRNSLYRDYVDASRGYRAAIIRNEKEESGYELKLRQAEQQYEQIAKEPIKKRIGKEFDINLTGEWDLNGALITIDSNLLINKQPINILSDQQFSVKINKEKVTFNRIKEDLWVSKNKEFILSRQKKNKKLNK